MMGTLEDVNIISTVVQNAMQKADLGVEALRTALRLFALSYCGSSDGKVYEAFRDRDRLPLD